MMSPAPFPLTDLPPLVDVETVPILKLLPGAHRHLAELKGRAATIPNPGILIDTLALQEARASSEIENIVTTQDDLYRAELYPDSPASPDAKEVARYRQALKSGFEDLRRHGLITNRSIINMFQVLMQREEGFRSTPGTTLRNDRTGEVVHVPPRDANEIRARMDALERFINVEETGPEDPLIRMALIHHQFESIHPFTDGNGRIGRILNVLYLARSGLLETPILYLSRHITERKADYYRLLQSVRDTNDWQNWICYMLEGVATTARTTLNLVEGMRGLMIDYKHRMRAQLPKRYSQDLLNNLFRHPYTRIEFVERDLGVSRATAMRYLDDLAAHGFVEKMQLSRRNYYINAPLVRLFLDPASQPEG